MVLAALSLPTKGSSSCSPMSDVKTSTSDRVGASTDNSTGTRRLKIPDTFAGLWEKPANLKPVSPFLSVPLNAEFGNRSGENESPLAVMLGAMSITQPHPDLGDPAKDDRGRRLLAPSRRPGCFAAALSGQFFESIATHNCHERAGLPYRHRTFSFENEESPVSSPDTEPEPTIISNRGGLLLTTPHDSGSEITQCVMFSDPLDPIDLRQEAHDDYSANDILRSISSEYPSEGMRTPELTVSPPGTFHRRIYRDILPGSNQDFRLISERRSSGSHCISLKHTSGKVDAATSSQVQGAAQDALFRSTKSLESNNSSYNGGHQATPTQSLSHHPSPSNSEVLKRPYADDVVLENIVSRVDPVDNSEVITSGTQDTDLYSILNFAVKRNGHQFHSGSFDPDAQEVILPRPSLRMKYNPYFSLSTQCLPGGSSNTEPQPPSEESWSVVARAHSTRSRVSLKSRISARIRRLSIRRWVARKLTAGKRDIKVSTKRWSRLRKITVTRQTSGNKSAGIRRKSRAITQWLTLEKAKRKKGRAASIPRGSTKKPAASSTAAAAVTTTTPVAVAAPARDEA